jgi:broad specificity phosphatase PhoE
MAYALYISHPQVEMDPAIPVPQWSLSARGRERTKGFAGATLVKGLKRLVSSREVKAQETAAILGAALGIPVTEAEEFGEIDRSVPGYVPADKFEELANLCFARPEESAEGWERAVDAQARVVAAFEAVMTSHDLSEPIGFVGHGGVGTLLKSHLGKRAISRAGDQPLGGGNAYMIRSADRLLLGDWMPFERFAGYGEV